MEKLLAALMNHSDDEVVVKLTKYNDKGVPALYIVVVDPNNHDNMLGANLNSLPNHVDLDLFILGMVNSFKTNDGDTYVDGMMNSSKNDVAEERTLKLYFDGSATKGIYKGGVYITDNDASAVENCHRFHNCKSSNESEYNALIAGVQDLIIYVTQNTHRQYKHILIYGDSKLVINQVSGEYKVNKPALKSLRDKARNCIKELEKVLPKKHGIQYQWIARDKNSVADKLSKL